MGKEGRRQAGGGEERGEKRKGREGIERDKKEWGEKRTTKHFKLWITIKRGNYTPPSNYNEQ